ncbi:MAG: winged helix-turn-helix domain-containing protein [Actinomycetota bacterium]|nr:winged helix-turn-helix domain-containing protein [Actinomycetota bacterium]
MKIYLCSPGTRKELLLELLEGEFEVMDYRPREEEPGTGDVLVLDLVEEASDWRSRISNLRKSLPEGVKMLAVLRFDQLRDVGGGVALDDFVLDGSTGEEIRARARRLAGEGKETAQEVGLVIDEDRYQVKVDGMPVELTFKEFELLRFLASRPGKVFTREVLLEQVWGYDYFGGTRTVDVHIRRIRSKIEREGRAYIRTIRGVGYIFEPSDAGPS